MSKLSVTPYEDSLSLRNKLCRLIWNFFACFFFKPFIGPIFNKWRIFVLRCFGSKIGKGCKIRSSVKIWAPWNMILKDYVALGPQVRFYNVDKIIIGTKVAISQYAHLCSASHNIYKDGSPLITSPISIESFAWVASDAYVGPGVTIGEGAVVAARGVVIKDVDPWTVVGGNPARFIKKREIK